MSQDIVSIIVQPLKSFKTLDKSITFLTFQMKILGAKLGVTSGSGV